jgi:hypothetical protein
MPSSRSALNGVRWLVELTLTPGDCDAVRHELGAVPTEFEEKCCATHFRVIT